MRRGRSAQEPLLPVLPDPEQAFKHYRKQIREMAQQIPVAEQMAELRRLLELSQAETIAANAKIQTAEDQATAKQTALEELQAAHEALPKTAADYLKPMVRMNASPLVLPAVPNAFRELRPNLLTLIKTIQFSGNPLDTSECSLRHLKDFLDICDTTASDAVALEFIRMKAFKFTLTGAAADWFNRLPAASITSWTELSDAFTDKFFPAHRTKEGRRKIYDFVQGDRESLDMAWERYKSLIHACPTHNLPLYQIISIFFDAMNDFSRQRINSYTNNKFVPAHRTKEG